MRKKVENMTIAMIKSIAETRSRNVISTMADSKSGNSKYSWTIFCNSFNKNKDREKSENKEN
jgi:hypothetical protein